MTFLILLIISTLGLAGTAAYFSIYGLAQIFSGIFASVVTMGVSLEAGKLIAVSYLYRHWKDTSFIMRTYLISAIFVLMGITSAGIFGYLSMGYQQDMLPLKEMQQLIVSHQDAKKEISALKQERIERKQQIDNDIAALPNNFITGRQRLMKANEKEMATLINDIEKYTIALRAKSEEINKLKTKILHQKTHTGPIIFIAKAFDREVDDATKWIILLIIFAFDPLAVALTIQINFLTTRKPKINNVEEQESSETTTLPSVSQEMSTNEIKQLINEMNQNKALTPSEILQKRVLEEMLIKKEVTSKVRNPTKN